MKYTIVMPSRNRGTAALKSVLWMRANLPKSVDFLVVDNASTEDTEGYHALAMRPDVKVVHEPKAGFLEAFSTCLANVKSGVAIFCSDEDVIPAEAVLRLYKVDWPKTAIVRGSIEAQEGVTGGNLVSMPEDVYLEKGAEALTRYGFANAYMSGTCYHLDLFAPALPYWTKGRHKHGSYPHLYLDLLGCAVGGVQILKQATALEGEPDTSSPPPSQYDNTYSIGSRIDQHISLRDGLFDAMQLMGWDLDTFSKAYVALCRRTLRFIARVNRPQYEAARLEKNGCVSMAVNVCMMALIDWKHCAPAFEWIQGQVMETVGGKRADTT